MVSVHDAGEWPSEGSVELSKQITGQMPRGHIIELSGECLAPARRQRTPAESRVDPGWMARLTSTVFDIPKPTAKAFCLPAAGYDDCVRRHSAQSHSNP
ncbi:uncharacterized protein B0I36DRAFT_116226 [Microdochium trichocladiopsis]|uniref:Uncharacterized protein n=1 Tax=Microdochium trichocladiopsis TaxID=1682393 RepID=A0A9P8Y925_9PEZI|nr:uncharacterized protein B0I36DRAFT_116226 [Microdochium trichocladiopsis]KAH7030930.1 hypothetical protein B0I36DRAFT_116226 [Microdochium trichocladiopsis]